MLTVPTMPVTAPLPSILPPSPPLPKVAPPGPYNSPVNTVSTPGVVPRHLLSILELQQVHHRHALTQQQANFMMLLQQQQQAESNEAFKSVFQSLI
jgi:hypothetical protein